MNKYVKYIVAGIGLIVVAYLLKKFLFDNVYKSFGLDSELNDDNNYLEEEYDIIR